MIDKDPFPSVASINIVATDLRVMVNSKKVRRFSPSSRIRKVWMPKQYLVYKDDLATRRSVHATRTLINS